MDEYHEEAGDVFRLVPFVDGYLLEKVLTYRPTCHCCGTEEDVTMEPSRTMYPYEPPLHTVWQDIDPSTAHAYENPNAPIPLCPSCADEHHAEWDARWKEYYAGLL